MEFFQILLLIGYVGLVNFLKSCTFPFIAGFFIFFLSLTFWHLSVRKEKSFWATFKYALLFSLGFLLIFVAKAATITAIGQSLTLQATFYTRLGGIIIALIGVAILPIALGEKFVLKRWAGWSSLLAGGTFALSWQPCSKFVIPVIQSMLGKQETFVAGVLFLTLVGLGIVIPLIVMSVVISLLVKYIKMPESVIRVGQFIGGITLIILGFLFLTNNIAIFFGLVGDVQNIFINK